MMNYKTWFMILFAFSILGLSQSAQAVLKSVDPRYKVEHYHTYLDDTNGIMPWGFAFDTDGAMYFSQNGTSSSVQDGYIIQITRADVAAGGDIATTTETKIATGLFAPDDIEWGGGTPFGNFIYFVDGGPNGNTNARKVYKLDVITGVKTPVTSYIYEGPHALAFDANGTFGNDMYVGSRGTDRIMGFDTSGTKSILVNLPSHIGAFELEIDPSGAYNNLMFLGFEDWTYDNGGLHTITPSGVRTKVNLTTPASKPLIYFDFDDTTQQYFGGALYGSSIVPGAKRAIWRINPDFSVEEIVRSADLPEPGIRYVEFNPFDGFLYILQFDSSNGHNIVSRVIPADYCVTEQASNPSPADFDPMTPTTQDLNVDVSWVSQNTTASHDVYLSSNQTDVQQRAVSAFQGNQLSTTFDPGTLSQEQTYYWAIDETKQFVPTWATTSVSNAVSLNGSNNYVDFGSCSSCPLQPTFPVMISAWVFFDETLNEKQDIMTFGKDTTIASWTGLWITQAVDPATIAMSYGDGQGYDHDYRKSLHSTIELKSNNWNHVAFVYKDDLTMEMYINGVKDVEATYSGFSTSSVGYGSASTKVGLEDFNGALKHFNGLIDDLRIYDYVTPADYSTADADQLALQLFKGENPITNAQLAGHWNFETLTANVVEDQTANNNDGMLINGTTNSLLTDAGPGGKIGGALQFDGVDDYMKIDSVSELAFAPNAFSVSSWVYVGNTPGIWNTIMEYDRGGSNWFGMWVTGTSRFHFRVGNKKHDSLQQLSLNRWYLLTGVYDPATEQMHLYIDNVLDRSESTTGIGNFDTAATSELTIGAYNAEDSEYFQGSIDDVRIYNTNLSLTDVQNIYAGSPPTNPIVHWTLDGHTRESIANNHGALNGANCSVLPGNVWSFRTEDPTLIAHWRFDESDPITIAVDATGHGHNGSCSSCPTSTTGQIVNGFNFDGSKTVTVPSHSDLEQFTEFTLSAWFKPTDEPESGWGRIISKGDTGTGDDYALVHVGSGANDEKLQFRVNTGSGSQPYSSSKLTMNEWTHVVGVWDGSTAQIYINGVADNSSPITGTLQNSGQPLTFGEHNNSTTRGIKGHVDDPRVYSRALSAQDVLTIYNQGINPCENDLDGDGYGIGASCLGPDCDDNNPAIWQNLSGYVDSDGDGYGAGSIVNNICSGNSLPAGYAATNDDCDDNNATIYPGATEIPYNGIDEDCNGSDLTDVDGDTYDAIVAGGTDCDDNNNTVYPGATEICDGIVNTCPQTGTPDVGASCGTGFICFEGACCPDVDNDNICDDNYVNSVTHNGFTWHFDNYYYVGQFVTGDWYVLTDATTNKVKIIEITHGGVALDISSNKNGSMINPLGGSNQGYDNGVSGYQSGLRFNYSVATPGELLANQSLVTAKSVASGDYDCTPDSDGPRIRDVAGICVKASHTKIHSAAVLTVLDQAPPIDAFRPPYSGSSKPIYRESDLNKNLLLSLTIPNMPTVADLDNVADHFKYVWLDHKGAASGRLMHPVKNMPNYGREIGTFISNAAVLLSLDFTQSEKNELLINFLQFGIDTYHVAINGGNWAADGGHMNGRKWPIIFAGMLLDHNGMKDIDTYAEVPANGLNFGEDDHTYWGNNGLALFGKPDIYNSPYEPPTCTGNSGAKDVRDKPDYLLDGCGVYRDCCTVKTWSGYTLVAMLMTDNAGVTGRTWWDYEPLFVFMDRWFAQDSPGYGTDKLEGSISGGSYIQELWDKYGTCATSVDCVGNPMGPNCVSITNPCRPGAADGCHGSWNKKRCGP